MTIKNLKATFLVSLFMISTLYPDEVTFKIGNIKYDYNNLEFTYTGSEGTATFNVGKLSFSTQNSGFEFNEINENAKLDVGPSKLILQNLNLDFFENYSRNSVKFNLGTLKFDIMDCSFDVMRGDEPSINSFNAKFSTSNVNLDLSNVLNFPEEAQAFLNQLGMRIDKISINRANINTSYNQSNQFKFDLDGATSLANFKINVQATVNEQYPERSNFQMCKLTVSNLSKEAQAVLGLIQAQSGVIIPMQNGSIVFDVKDMLNMSQQQVRPQ